MLSKAIGTLFPSSVNIFTSLSLGESIGAYELTTAENYFIQSEAAISMKTV